jgi:hypothetical protein
LEFCTNDAHADATLRILKRHLKRRSKAPEDLVCENERKINSFTAAAREVAKHRTVLVVVSLIIMVIYNREQCVYWT